MNLTIYTKITHNSIFNTKPTAINPTISSYFVAKQQRSLWIQGLRKKMIQAHSELCNWSFFPKNAVDAAYLLLQ
jgi:hypothetical protein